MRSATAGGRPVPQARIDEAVKRDRLVRSRRPPHRCRAVPPRRRQGVERAARPDPLRAGQRPRGRGGRDGCLGSRRGSGGRTPTASPGRDDLVSARRKEAASPRRRLRRRRDRVRDLEGSRACSHRLPGALPSRVRRLGSSCAEPGLQPYERPTYADRARALAARAQARLGGSIWQSERARRPGRRDRDRSAPNARPRTVRSVDRRGRTDDEPGHLRCGWANAPTARRHRHVPERRVARSAWVGPSEDRSHPRLLRACGLSVA